MGRDCRLRRSFRNRGYRSTALLPERLSGLSGVGALWAMRRPVETVLYPVRALRFYMPALLLPPGKLLAESYSSFS